MMSKRNLKPSSPSISGDIMDIAFYQRKVSELEGRRSLMQEQVRELQKERESAAIHMENCNKARAITQIVAASVQKKIEFHISSLVSMALSAVFPDPYKFELKYTVRRNKTEADLVFTKRGKEITDILSTGGGGVGDIASLALRVAAWSLRKNRPVLFLDEPTKFLHDPVYQEKASIVIKEIADKVGLQIIMISDQKEMVAAADKMFRIGNENGKSFVEEDH